MRRGAELEGVQQEAELLLGLGLADAHDCEDALLDIAAVDTDGPTANLVSVAHDVVGVGQGAARVIIEGVQALGLGRGEGVVHGRPGRLAQGHVAFGARLGGRLEQGCIHHPYEGPRVVVDETAAPPHLQASGTQQGSGSVHGARGEEDAVSGLSAYGLGQAFALGLGDVLGDGPAQRLVLTHSDVGQALGAALLGPLLPGVEGPARLGGAAGHDHGADVGVLEDPEGSSLEVVGQIHQLQAEAQVGLVRAVLLHGVAVGHPRDGGGQLVADEGPYLAQNVLGDGDDVILLDEAHLHVQLGELGLAVGPEVLVAVAAGDLVVALHSGDHEQLLEELGALGQGVPGAGRQPCGHQEVPRPLGRGAGQGRGLDLDEVVRVQDPARGLADLGAQADGALHGAAAQVQVAVAQAGLLPHLAGVLGVVGDLEGQRGGHVEDLDVGDHDLDLARGQIGVRVALGPGRDLAGDGQDVLGAQVVGDLLADDDLGDP